MLIVTYNLQRDARKAGATQDVSRTTLGPFRTCAAKHLNVFQIKVFGLNKRDRTVNITTGRELKPGVPFPPGTNTFLFINTGFLDFVHRPEFYN
jgi:hypothetical protein